MKLQNDYDLLFNWYSANRRPLPWRQNKDPYRIWLSEVMLQQTTVTAVIPYFETFLKKFPNVKALSKAPENMVLEAWAGLGYYSRARNLHRAAKIFATNGFPKTAAELLEIPGFGPYTSRAVASIAFGEPVGVLDGNVIRVLSRKYGLKLEWWNQKNRQPLQDLSNQLASLGESDVMNQALMELGATICTPQKVVCVLCPWNSSCVAFKNDLVGKLPLKKPRREVEVWVWKVLLSVSENQVALIQNDYAPFLKGQWIFPGTIAREKTKPTDYQVRHSITHHDIFIQIVQKKSLNHKGIQWIALSQVKKLNPSSLLTKILKQIEEK